MPLRLIRFVALFLIPCLVADPTTAAMFAPQPQALVCPIKIPARWGRVTEVCDARSRLQAASNSKLFPKTLSLEPRAPLIVLIQDLHGNVGVQRNIAEIIKHLERKQGTPHLASGHPLPRGEGVRVRGSPLTVFVEGASGSFDVSLFQGIEEKRIRQKTTQYFLENLRISGAEVAAIESKEPLHLWGIDDKALYLQNLQTFYRASFKSPVPHPQHPVWKTYYAIAAQRNVPLALNTLRHLDLLAKAGAVPSLTALVVGGYHTKGITEILKANHIAYVVVTPRVEKLGDEHGYTERLREQAHWARQDTMAFILGLARKALISTAKTLLSKDVPRYVKKAKEEATGINPESQRLGTGDADHPPLLKVGLVLSRYAETFGMARRVWQVATPWLDRHQVTKKTRGRLAGLEEAVFSGVYFFVPFLLLTSRWHWGVFPALLLSLSLAFLLMVWEHLPNILFSEKGMLRPTHLQIKKFREIIQLGSETRLILAGTFLMLLPLGLFPSMGGVLVAVALWHGVDWNSIRAPKYGWMGGMVTDEEESVTSLYQTIHRRLAAVEFKEGGFESVQKSLVDAIGESYRTFFNRVADLLYEVRVAMGSRVHRGPDHDKSVETAYQHSLVVISSVAQFFAVCRGENIPSEQSGLGRLAFFNENRASASFDHIRELFSSLGKAAQQASMDNLLQAALLHDIAKYGEFLNPAKAHEHYAYGFIGERNFGVPEIVREVVRLHVHFGITYNGEFNPQVLIDEIQALYKRGWSKENIQTVMILTALFTFADVASYGPITNTMVEKVTDMTLGDSHRIGLVHIIDALDQPKQIFRRRAAGFIRRLSKDMIVGLLRFGDMDVDGYPKAHYRKAIVKATAETEGIVTAEDWKILSSVSEIRSFRFLNYLIKALRLQSFPATLNFIRLVLKVAKDTDQTQIVFVNVQGQPIHKAGDLPALLKKLVTQLPFAADAKTDDHRNYYFVNKAGVKILDSPSLSVRDVQGQKILVVQFPYFISEELKETLDQGGDIVLSDDLREQYLAGLSGAMRSPFNIFIPVDPGNLYQQTFNPFTTMVITQAIVNIRRPKKVIVAGDACSWARDHLPYIAAVLAGNDVEVVLINDPLPVGVVPGLLNQRPDLGDLVLNANEGGRGRNFGIQVYTQDGSLTPDEFKDLYQGEGGIDSFLKGTSQTVHVKPPPLPQRIPYQLPSVEFSEIKSLVLWFADQNLPNALDASFSWANNVADGVNWWHGLPFGVVPEGRLFASFENSSHLIKGARPFYRTLQNRPETTAILLNANGSRVGLAEKVPRQVGKQLEALGAVVVGEARKGDVIVHYPPFLIWTLLAGLYADQYVGDEKGKAFVGSFPSFDNVRKIAKSRGIAYLPTDVSEYALAQVTREFEMPDRKNRVLLFSEPTGNGNVWMTSQPIERIERQSNSFAVAMMLLYFNQEIKPEHATFGAYLLTIPKKFKIKLSQFEQVNVREEDYRESIRQLITLKGGDKLGRYKVQKIEIYSDVSKGRKIFLSDDIIVSMYYSYRERNATVRIFIDAPDKKLIEEIKNALNLNKKRASGVIQSLKAGVLAWFPHLASDYDTQIAPKIEERLFMALPFALMVASWIAHAFYGIPINPALFLIGMNTINVVLGKSFVGLHQEGDRPTARKIAAVRFVLILLASVSSVFDPWGLLAWPIAVRLSRAYHTWENKSKDLVPTHQRHWRDVGPIGLLLMPFSLVLSIAYHTSINASSFLRHTTIRDPKLFTTA